ncbi:MAG TPA: acyl-CoA dehydrogenase family protein [Burkholderiales bacterium]|jgi:citronellyl-CoA dehydrogenase|nr:acyl-CoA dehydrogenase family protein [Burkholderiales bacterium]
MKFTQEHEEIRRTMKKFIDAEINPHVDAWEEAEQFPAHEVFKKLGNLGMLGLTKPEAYGGAGLDYSYGMVFAETLGAIRCGGVPMAIGVQTDMATPALARFGSDELRKEFLAPAIAGDQVSCIGVSEPGAGSDVASIRTTARKDGGDYVINGSKMWITNSLQADWMCLLANTSEGAAHKNKSLIILPMDAKGISKSKIHKIGMMSSDTGLLHFDDVRVPQRHRIGDEGAGFTYQMQQFQEERLWAAAASIDSLMRTLNDTIAYIGERRMFGRTVLDFQYVHYRLAELKTEIEALRALTYRACEMYVAGEDVTELASMAKLKSGRLRREVSDACLQYWGGMGFTWDNPVSRAYRDGRLGSIGGGADEVMLGIICKYMHILPKNRG